MANGVELPLTLSCLRRHHEITVGNVQIITNLEKVTVSGATSGLPSLEILCITSNIASALKAEPACPLFARVEIMVL